LKDVEDDTQPEMLAPTNKRKMNNIADEKKAAACMAAAF